MKRALPYHERITDPTFRRAVDLLDAGDAATLAELLQQNPELVRQRVAFEGENYFQNPSLLEFIAENRCATAACRQTFSKSRGPFWPRSRSSAH